MIYVVEDNEDFRTELADGLRKFDFEVMALGTLAELRAALAQHKFGRGDVVLLDLTLQTDSAIPEIVPISACGAGCIVLTGSPSETDKIIGLELGADDYVRKGSSLREVVARIRAVKRRTLGLKADGEDHAGAQPRGSWTIDLMCAAVLSPDGRSMHLTATELAVFTRLASDVGKAIGRDVLLQVAFNRDAWFGDRSLDNVVARIRTKLVALGADRYCLRSVRNQGYMFAGLPGGHVIVGDENCFPGDDVRRDSNRAPDTDGSRYRPAKTAPL